MALLAWNDVGHSGSLTNYGGSYTVNSSGQTFEDYRFTSTLTQENAADNLTVRNCHFDLTDNDYALRNRYNENPNVSALVEDCTFEGTTSTHLLFGGSGTKVFRMCQFRDARGDFVKLFGNGAVTFEDCYFGGLSRTEVPPEDFHADGFQTSGTHNVTITRCTWDSPPAVGGLNVPVTPGSWLESDGVAAGLTAGSIYYKASIGYFTHHSTGGIVHFTDCHFKRMGSNGIQVASPFGGSVRLSDCKFYPTGIYSWKSGDNQNLIEDYSGANVWVENANDLQGTSRQVNESVFTGEILDLGPTFNKPVIQSNGLVLANGLPLLGAT